MGCGASGPRKDGGGGGAAAGSDAAAGSAADRERKVSATYSAGDDGDSQTSPRRDSSDSPRARSLAEQVKTRLASKALPGVHVYHELPADAVVQKQIGVMLPEIAHVEAERSVDAAAVGAAAAFANVRDAVLRWDVFAGDTRVYLPAPVLAKDMVLATCTCLSKGMYPLSFDDVSELSELDIPGKMRRLRAVTTSRDRNICDGIVSVEVCLLSGPPPSFIIRHSRRVRLAHQALRNRSGGSEQFAARLKVSVEGTLDRLVAFALGQAPAAPPPPAPGGGFMASVQAKLASLVLDHVDVYPSLPEPALVNSKIADMTKHIVAEAATVHVACGGVEAFERVRRAVLRWDVYGGETKVYLPHESEVVAEGMVLGVSTSISRGVCPLSFETVAVVEDDDAGPEMWRRLRVIVTTRHENIVDGNYDIEVTLWHADSPMRGRKAGDVVIFYQKRQNLVYYALRKGAGSMAKYASRTAQSVARTLARLRSFATTGEAGGAGDGITDELEIEAGNSAALVKEMSVAWSPGGARRVSVPLAVSPERAINDSGDVSVTSA